MDFLDRFYMARIGIRMLISQHIALHAPKEGFVGVIDKACSPAAVVRDAISDAGAICERVYGTQPDVNIMGNVDLRFRYVSEHLYYMVFELIKNSMRATVELKSLHPIDVVIADSDKEVCIKISDRGGGIPRPAMNKIWGYKYTTYKEPVVDFSHMIRWSSVEGADGSIGGIDASMPPPIAGFGFGLPLSRLYARYFGGDLSIMSMDGWGTDAYLHLSKLGDQQETLPA
jgi:pyruvate dehydrogenase kinase 2/3/4